MGEAGGMKTAPTLRLLTGPTASGKTETALRWAESCGGEILSCDSVCIYRGLNIGSAKPSAAEQARAPHHGIDLAEPAERYSVAAYVTYARGIIDSAIARGKPLMVTGGSGFYFAAFFGPVADALEIPEAASTEAKELQNRGVEFLRKRLEELEGGKLPTWLDVDNPIRLTKALERRLASGRPLDELRDDFLGKPGPFADLKFETEVIDRPDPELRTRIATRTRAMLAGGLIEEATWLLSLNLDDTLPAARAVGYRETMDWLREGQKQPLETLAQTIDLNTWGLVGKQRKWFRRLGLTAPLNRVK
jgi:tRNA dimethylallyltransferase